MILDTGRSGAQNLEVGTRVEGVLAKSRTSSRAAVAGHSVHCSLAVTTFHASVSIAADLVIRISLCPLSA